MIDSTVALVRERGVAGTSFADVLAHSGAPRGSIYHHFPGGKGQLVEDATRSAADTLGRGVRRILDADDTVGALRALVALWRRGLEKSDYRAGCPMAAAALGTEDGARVVAAAAFDEWRDVIADKLRAEGAPADRAASVAALVLASLEGALMLSQARRSPEPLDTALTELEVVCTSVVG
ncbi:TetR/AcrR family transcriptional regulator [Rhodococcus sp. HNM0569]|nr:TetR/AcrR family transcriptional regulator [Rhodococcus sp. HNM0569]NLU82108.1 TetR/AcrR family transcriptional regulator [Rhodococcus sp. HNM0569]